MGCAPLLCLASLVGLPGGSDLSGPRGAPGEGADGGPGAGAARLHVEADRVWRVTPSGRAELGCTLAGGTGTIHGRARHPGGTEFFAAERGLFALSDDVRFLDPVELRDGVPAGALVGIAILDPDRIWLATGEAVFCVDSRQFFGRASFPRDGFPSPPYLGLGVGPDGSLLLETVDGAFRFSPGRLVRPSVQVVSVDGEPYREGRRYPVDESGSLALVCRATAEGEVTLRYRLRHHHLWKALDPEAPRIAGLEPGEHTLLVAAWDRELGRSESVPIPVNVAYPRVFDKKRLIPLALGVGLAVCLGFGLLAFARGGGRLRFAKAGVSSFVALAIGLQLLVGLVPHGRSWPFVGFTMYLERYVEGSLTYQTALVLVLRNGRQLRVEPYDAGYGLYELRRTLSEVMHGDQTARDAYLEKLRRRYPRRHLAGYLIQDERRRLTRDGPVRVAPTVLCVHPADVLERKVAHANR